jgi:hypothetical protein
MTIENFSGAVILVVRARDIYLAIFFKILSYRERAILIDSNVVATITMVIFVMIPDLDVDVALEVEVDASAVFLVCKCTYLSNVSAAFFTNVLLEWLVHLSKP